jgi:hypothetical protein
LNKNWTFIFFFSSISNYLIKIKYISEYSQKLALYFSYIKYNFIFIIKIVVEIHILGVIFILALARQHAPVCGPPGPMEFIQDATEEPTVCDLENRGSELGAVGIAKTQHEAISNLLP